LQAPHCLANTPQDCVEPELEGEKEGGKNLKKKIIQYARRFVSSLN